MNEKCIQMIEIIQGVIPSGVPHHKKLVWIMSVQ